MYGDEIKCLNPCCGRMFTDKTRLKMQDSRTGNFKNICPDCYSTNTKNTHEKTRNKQRFIKKVTHSGGEKKNMKRVQKPNLNTEYVADEVLGTRQECDITEDKREYTNTERTLPQAESQSDSKHHVQTSTINFVEKTGGTFDTSPVKSFTPIELMEHRLKAQHKELLLPPDNRKRYRGWRYDRRLKK